MADGCWPNLNQTNQQMTAVQRLMRLKRCRCNPGQQTGHVTFSTKTAPGLAYV